MSFDSLTDIVANSVGIVLFLMIFAVVSARGSFVRKRLPMVQPTTKERVVFLCSGGTVRPCDVSQLIQRLLEGMPRSLTYDNVLQIRDRFNGRRVRDDYFEAVCRCEVKREREEVWNGYVLRWGIEYLAVEIYPLPGALGETAEMAARAGSMFRQKLFHVDRDRQWLLFAVDVDSIEVYNTVRDIARELGFNVGWVPARVIWPLRLVLIPQAEASKGQEFGPLPEWIGPQ